MMKRIHLACADFWRLVESPAPPADFPAACRRLHILPGVLNEYLQREIGANGEELLAPESKLICDWLQK